MVICTANGQYMHAYMTRKKLDLKSTSKGKGGVLIVMCFNGQTSYLALLIFQNSCINTSFVTHIQSIFTPLTFSEN